MILLCPICLLEYNSFDCYHIHGIHFGNEIEDRVFEYPYLITTRITYD